MKWGSLPPYRIAHKFKIHEGCLCVRHSCDFGKEKVIETYILYSPWYIFGFHRRRKFFDLFCNYQLSVNFLPRKMQQLVCTNRSSNGFCFRPSTTRSKTDTQSISCGISVGGFSIFRAELSSPSLPHPHHQYF